MFFGVTGEGGRSQQPSDSRQSWSQRGEEKDKPLRRTRAGRPLRDRRYRVAEESKQTKRLFTPEIKKFLKGWLIRRRKNPYPNRSEKKELAMQTGLTYMQICNWFANWRRKLKKCSRAVDQRSQGTWGPLIAGYNRQARGNVEQFSISSDDSLWDEANYNSPEVNLTTASKEPNDKAWSSPHSLQSTSTEDDQWTSSPRTVSVSVPETVPAGTPVLLKWLESAARFRPREVCWSTRATSWCSIRRHPPRVRDHHREELDAAEALTFLSTRSAPRHEQCV